MKTLIMLLVLFMAVLSFGQISLFAETIYKKDGGIIQAKVIEKTADAVWYETTAGDITEQVSIDLKDVDKILNDDGTISSYSPPVTAAPPVQAP